MLGPERREAARTASRLRVEAQIRGLDQLAIDPRDLVTYRREPA